MVNDPSLRARRAKQSLKKSNMRILIGITLGLVFSSSAARAQDVATEHTQLLNNIELITENLRQLQSLENQISMINNQVEELKSVANYQNSLGDSDDLRNELTQMTNQGTALSDQTLSLLSTIQQQNIVPTNGTLTDSQELLDQSTMNIVQNAVTRVKQLRQSYQQETSLVNSLMDKNNQAVGQTQAIQTSNEIAAQNIAQNQSTQELLSEQISIQSAMVTKQLEDEKDEDDKMKQIFNGEDDGSSIFGSGNYAQ